MGVMVAKDDPFPSLFRSRSGVVNVEFVFCSLSFTVDPECIVYSQPSCSFVNVVTPVLATQNTLKLIIIIINVP